MLSKFQKQEDSGKEDEDDSSSTSSGPDDVIAKQSIKGCEVCNFGIEPPYNKCEFEHLYCLACTRKLRICYICHRLILGPTIEVFKLSLETFELNCRNKIRGCEYKGKMDDLEKHMKMCEHALFSCPFATNEYRCILFGKYSNVKSHFEEKHPDVFKWNPERLNERKRGVLNKFRDCCMDLKNMKWGNPPGELKFVFSSQREMFLLRFEEIFGHLTFTVELLALEYKKSKNLYEYRITFGNEENRRTEKHICGHEVIMLIREMKFLCEDSGDLNYEIEILDK